MPESVSRSAAAVPAAQVGNRRPHSILCLAGDLSQQRIGRILG